MGKERTGGNQKTPCITAYRNRDRYMTSWAGAEMRQSNIGHRRWTEAKSFKMTLLQTDQPTDWLTNRATNQQTDKIAYRVAYPVTKTVRESEIWLANRPTNKARYMAIRSRTVGQEQLCKNRPKMWQTYWPTNLPTYQPTNRHGKV